MIRLEVSWTEPLMPFVSSIGTRPEMPTSNRRVCAGEPHELELGVRGRVAYEGAAPRRSGRLRDRLSVAREVGGGERRPPRAVEVGAFWQMVAGRAMHPAVRSIARPPLARTSMLRVR
jgi:hypothetical protein